LGLGSLEDTPDESVLPTAIKTASIDVKKEYLKSLCFQVVDKSVLREEEMNRKEQ
jgi:hypothetical protein